MANCSNMDYHEEFENHGVIKLTQKNCYRYLCNIITHCHGVTVSFFGKTRKNWINTHKKEIAKNNLRVEYRYRNKCYKFMNTSQFTAGVGAARQCFGSGT